MTANLHRDIYIRTHSVLMALDQPRSIREISELTGIRYNMVYRAIPRLISMGFNVKSHKKRYWLENYVEITTREANS